MPHSVTVSKISCTANLLVVHQLHSGWISWIVLAYFTPTFTQNRVTDVDPKEKLPNINIESVDLSTFITIAGTMPQVILDYYIPSNEHQPHSEIAAAIAEMLHILFITITSRQDLVQYFLVYHEYAYCSILNWHQNKLANVRLDIWDEGLYLWIMQELQYMGVVTCYYAQLGQFNTQASAPHQATKRPLGQLQFQVAGRQA
ncbi:hypothetical protein Moror_7530 [Moniliophthora roreri MCA 2997]|uniref:Uncharacterized protein n=2 Tax=Moniliophthora roreri TaxID=221103 RepID=V2WUR7_MONRO|nr:hypothetical protein Moror_7530 [Moniliophthora roreri MCA 2997]